MKIFGMLLVNADLNDVLNILKNTVTDAFDVHEYVVYPDIYIAVKLK